MVRDLTLLTSMMMMTIINPMIKIISVTMSKAMMMMSIVMTLEDARTGLRE